MVPPGEGSGAGGGGRAARGSPPEASASAPRRRGCARPRARAAPVAPARRSGAPRAPPRGGSRGADCGRGGATGDRAAWPPPLRARDGSRPRPVPQATLPQSIRSEEELEGEAEDALVRAPAAAHALREAGLQRRHRRDQADARGEEVAVLALAAFRADADGEDAVEEVLGTGVVRRAERI